MFHHSCHTKCQSTNCFWFFPNWYHSCRCRISHNPHAIFHIIDVVPAMDIYWYFPWYRIIFNQPTTHWTCHYEKSEPVSDRCRPRYILSLWHVYPYVVRSKFIGLHQTSHCLLQIWFLQPVSKKSSYIKLIAPQMTQLALAAYTEIINLMIIKLPLRFIFLFSSFW